MGQNTIMPPSMFSPHRQVAFSFENYPLNLKIVALIKLQFQCDSDISNKNTFTRLMFFTGEEMTDQFGRNPTCEGQTVGVESREAVGGRRQSLAPGS